MSEANCLRDHVRDRLSAALDQVLTAALGQLLGQVVPQVLQELDRALEDFKADSGEAEEVLKKITGFQYSELKIKEEPQSCDISALQPLEPPLVKQEPTDRGRCLSDASDVNENEQIQISFVTSLKDQDCCTEQPLSPKSSPDQDRGEEQEESSSECPQFSSEALLESKPEEPSISDNNLSTKLALKVPLLKLYPLFPKSDSKQVKKVVKNAKTTPAKRIVRVRRGQKTKELFMCACTELFSKEELEIHRTPQEGEDRPYGCPLVPTTLQIIPSKKRRRGQALNDQGGGRGKRMCRVSIKADERNGEEKILRCCRETFLKVLKEKKEGRDIGGKTEAGADLEEQADALGASSHAAGAEAEKSEAGAAFPCDACGRSFSWLPDLYRHRREHFSKPLWCPDCGRTFMRGVDLSAHLCVQTQRPYSCSVCGEAFFLHIQLQNHRRKHRKGWKERQRSSSRAQSGTVK